MILQSPTMRLIDPAGKGDGPRWTSGGQTFAFSAGVVADLDRRVKPLSDQGVVVYLILLTYASGLTKRDALLLHPAYDRAGRNAAPIAMFNIASPEGRAWLTAASEFLAARYALSRFTSVSTASQNNASSSMAS